MFRIVVSRYRDISACLGISIQTHRSDNLSFLAQLLDRERARSTGPFGYAEDDVNSLFVSVLGDEPFGRVFHLDQL